MADTDVGMAELTRISQSWERGLNDLRRDDTQLAPTQKSNLYRDLYDRGDRFRFYYGYLDDPDVSREAKGLFALLERELDFAVIRGEQNYRNEMHRQKMESRREWGQFLKNIGFNAAVFISGLISAYLAIRFGHLYP